MKLRWLVGWLVGCLGFNGPLRQYFSLYRSVSQREGERGEKRIDESKMSKQPPPAPTTSAVGPYSRPLPYCNPNCRTPRHRGGRMGDYAMNFWGILLILDEGKGKNLQGFIELLGSPSFLFYLLCLGYGTIHV